MRVSVFGLTAIVLAFGLLSSRPASASVVSALTDYNSGIYFDESGTLQPNSSAVFEYTLSPNMVNSITSLSQLSQINETYQVVNNSRVNIITKVTSLSEYSLSNAGILTLSGGSGTYSYQPTPLLKNQITLSGNDLFITFVNYSPTQTSTFLNQFTLGGAPAVIKSTIVAQGNLSAVPLPASFPLFAAIVVGLGGLGVCRRKQVV